MQIQPFEIKEKEVLAEGRTNFTVLKADDVVSKNKAKKGQTEPDQIKVSFKIWDKKGKEGYLIDYISYSPDFQWKLGAFLESLGLQRLAESGNINPRQFENKSGQCYLSIQESEEFGKQNRIKSYIKKDKGEAEASFISDEAAFIPDGSLPTISAARDFDDEINF